MACEGRCSWSQRCDYVRVEHHDLKQHHRIEHVPRLWHAHCICNQATLRCCALLSAFKLGTRILT